MPDLAKARAEIERSVGILRSRYHYEHPIFEHLAGALAALEGELAEPEAPAVEPPVEVEAEEEVSAEPESPAEPFTETPRRGRR